MLFRQTRYYPSQCLNLKCPGTIDDPKAMEYELVEYLGFAKPTEKTYAEWQKHYGLAEDYEMTAEEEGKMFDEFTTALIADFPEFTSPILEYEQI